MRYAPFLPLLLVVVTVVGACEAPPVARAFQVKSRAELIGGPRALGEVGDFILENGKARFLVQGEGFSRGFGVFGGGLLDADLVRAEGSGRGNSVGGEGKDAFGEMFPAFFLEALEPLQVDDPNNPGTLLPAITVESAGGPNQDAVVVVRGLGGDFLALTQNINGVLLGDPRDAPRLMFEHRYILHPGAQYLELETRVHNITNANLNFPNAALGGSEVPTPFGDVMLFGAGQKVFLPHEAGFDMRFRLEDVYDKGDVALPALPGLVAEFIASAGKDVSYGLMPLAPKPEDGDDIRNFAQANEAAFPGATDHSVHVPFIASAFTGVFQVLPARTLAPNDFQAGGNDEMVFRRLFFVGDGDVASISDQVYQALGDKVGTVQGRVLERQRPLVAAGASVIVLDEAGTKVTQMRADAEGRFDAALRPGKYRLVPVVSNATVPQPVSITVEEGKLTFQDVTVDSPAEVVVTVVEEGVGPVPAKASLVGVEPSFVAGLRPRDWLFDLSVGEPFRYTDFIPDDETNPDTLRYLESFDVAADGVIHMRGRPGQYTLVVSRGIEYDRPELPITLEAGAQKAVTVVIHRVIDTGGYVSADFHLHSQFSLDSGALLDDRITGYAAEGLEYAVSTDHNFVVDYQPVVQKKKLEKWLNTAIGLELTTIDRGHFNGYPFERFPGSLVKEVADGQFAPAGIASRTYGSFEWALRTPDDIFGNIRNLARHDVDGGFKDVIVQVNHPRDSILGYFDQYGVNADTWVVEGQTGLIAPDPEFHPEFAASAFSFDFDAVEVFNGKRYDFLRTFRVPASAPRVVVGGESKVVDPVSCCEVTIGDIYRDRPGFDCRDGGDTCACDADTFAFQLESGNCTSVGDVAFPGVVEDWLLLLRTGRTVIGTANSDSHEPEKEEPGSPRTFVRVPVDEPEQITPDQIVAGLRSGDVLMTNGPFVQVSIDGVGMGGTLQGGGGKTLALHVESAPWIRARTANIIQDGAVVASVAIDDNPFDADVPLTIDADGYVVVEVTGTDSMFPTPYPSEQTPLNFTDVIGALGGSFGLGGAAGALEPDRASVVTPYALTNPIWLDEDGDGTIAPSFELPALPPAARTASSSSSTEQPTLVRPRPWAPTLEESRKDAERELMRSMPLRKRLALAHLPRWMWPSNDRKDIRRVLVQFTRHAD